MSLKKNKVIDLYAGAGGLSLGAARAGFTLAAAVEIDKHANETHRRNFPATCHLDQDIATLSAADILRQANIQDGELMGVIGGPPCQGFSSIGRRDPKDVRNKLFAHFMRIVAEAKPIFFLAENVPGIQDDKNIGMLEDAFQYVTDDYHCLQPIVVKASEYGAPTSRTRLFFIGLRKDVCQDPEAARALISAPAEIPAVTVAYALKGLPKRVRSDWQTEAQGVRAVEKLPESHYALRIQGLIPEGVGDLAAIAQFTKQQLVNGNMGTVHSEDVRKRYAALLPGKTDSISRSSRLEANGFCPTLRAGTGSDKGSYQAVRPIHPTIGRVITPREAARLQGFPDWFSLHRTKWHSFRQIGNSVSPIVAEIILKNIKNALNNDFCK
ncbi:DNA cytosine methyltransferase [Ottowia thiooxydans]|uniref:DNA cytosine methyltransferase n=1 Tax=Ottowia thiooxydans TaxID=219182 RepID=UPI0004031CB4|nr:DNA cytosine methyltransferase [Ottowia thiooxydans]